MRKRAPPGTFRKKDQDTDFREISLKNPYPDFFILRLPVSAICLKPLHLFGQINSYISFYSKNPLALSSSSISSRISVLSASTV